jgi:hypothetical protein
VLPPSITEGRGCTGQLTTVSDALPGLASLAAVSSLAM